MKARTVTNVSGKKQTAGPAKKARIVTDTVKVAGSALPIIQVNQAYIDQRGLLGGEPIDVVIDNSPQLTIQGAIQPVFVVI